MLGNKARNLPSQYLLSRLLQNIPFTLSQARVLINWLTPTNCTMNTSQISTFCIPASARTTYLNLVDFAPQTGRCVGVFNGDTAEVFSGTFPFPYCIPRSIPNLEGALSTSCTHKYNKEKNRMLPLYLPSDPDPQRHRRSRHHKFHTRTILVYVPDVHGQWDKEWI